MLVKLEEEFVIAVVRVTWAGTKLRLAPEELEKEELQLWDWWSPLEELVERAGLWKSLG